jgi:hypothetical protein
VQGRDLVEDGVSRSTALTSAERANDRRLAWVIDVAGVNSFLPNFEFVALIIRAVLGFCLLVAVLALAYAIYLWGHWT